MRTKECLYLTIITIKTSKQIHLKFFKLICALCCHQKLIFTSAVVGSAHWSHLVYCLHPNMKIVWIFFQDWKYLLIIGWNTVQSTLNHVELTESAHAHFTQYAHNVFNIHIYLNNIFLLLFNVHICQQHLCTCFFLIYLSTSLVSAFFFFFLRITRFFFLWLKRLWTNSR